MEKTVRRSPGRVLLIFDCTGRCGARVGWWNGRPGDTWWGAPSMIRSDRFRNYRRPAAAPPCPRNAPDRTSPHRIASRIYLVLPLRLLCRGFEFSLRPESETLGPRTHFTLQTSKVKLMSTIIHRFFINRIRVALI